MTDTFNWKKFQFITEVQTALIANGITLSLESDAQDHRHLFSAGGVMVRLNEAFVAADKIPAELTAHEAACEFMKYACDNLREGTARPPAWLMPG